jgi:hypothetical protein
MIPALITVLLAVGSVAYLAWPLLGRVAANDDEEPEFDVLRERQQAAMEALRELDYERQIGKLTDAEYFPLRERYARQAMVLLKLLDQRDAARESELERAIAARRAGARPSGTPPARTHTAVSAVDAVASRSTRPWLVATGGAMLAVVAASMALLVSTVNRGAVQPAVLAVVPLAAPRALAFDPTGNGRLLAGGSNGMAASSDSGKTWSLVTTSGLPDGVVSFSPATGNSGLQALTANGDRWQSSDGGRTWQAVTGGITLPTGTQAVADVPGSPPLLVVATPDGLRASGDNGHTWSVANGFVNGLLPTKDDRDVVYAPTADQSTGPQGRTFHGLLFVATDRGLYASADGGQSWLARSLGGNLTALAVDPQNPSILLAMDTQGQLFRSQDAGATWGR